MNEPQPPAPQPPAYGLQRHTDAPDAEWPCCALHLKRKPDLERLFALEAE